MRKSILSIICAMLIALPQGTCFAQEREAGVFRVMSFNVRTWTRDTDRDSDAHWRKRMEAMERMIIDADPDIICFQEMLFPATRYVPDGYRRVAGVNVSHPIFVRKGLGYSGHSTSIYWESCLVEGVQVINVHSRWEKDVMLRVVRQVNGRLKGRSLACGDWNVSLRSLKEAGLNMSSAREMLGVPEVDTFANFTRAESHGAIDHFFVDGLTPVSYMMVTDGYGCTRISDHFPIVLEVRR